MTVMLTDAALEHILGRIPSLTIGVLGDLFLDRYLDLDAALTEPSVETGLDAYQVVKVRSYPGAAGTVINAGDTLTITAPTQSAGFSLFGTALDGTDTFDVEWVFGNGPAEIMTITVPGGNVVATGATILSFPATFTSDSIGETAPVPEPASLLLLGTGSLSFAAGALRKMKSAK